MKLNRNVSIVAGVIVVLIIFGGLAVSSAWGPDENRTASCRFGFGHGGHPSAMASGHMTDFALWRLDRMAEQLNLTEAQQDQYTEMRSKIKGQLEEGLKAHLSLKQGMAAEIRKEVPDMTYLTQTFKTGLTSLAQEMGEGLDQFALFYNTLDAQQQAKLMNDIRQKMEAHIARNEEGPVEE